MPWIAFAHEQSPTTKFDYDLDYTAMLTPRIIVQSLRRKHYLVFLVAIISIILKVQIILAPGLCKLETGEVSKDVHVKVLDLFNITKLGNQSGETSVYYMAQAIYNFDTRPPFGINITQNLAYQTFEAIDGFRGTLNARLATKVDGYFTERQCFKLRNYSYTEIPTSPLSWNRGSSSTFPFVHVFSINLRLWFEGCQEPILVDELRRGLDFAQSRENTGQMGYWSSHSALARSIRCTQLRQEESRSSSQSLYFALRFGNIYPNSSTTFLTSVSAVLCSSEMWMSKVQVVDDGVNPIVTPLPDEVKTPVIANL
ncbi:hypothetical protein CMUS01_15119 [Colletotrichum musicola]|uniref:Uncharacterized protein n=1 Tax=Colletotrichum musicola TaxID=2175873 RepID=A0A8H6MNQ3_9PEZI|nr:hypothetical protein CMUS01_15119 [Colletotrichum musicola]